MGNIAYRAYRTYGAYTFAGKIDRERFLTFSSKGQWASEGWLTGAQTHQNSSLITTRLAPL